MTLGGQRLKGWKVELKVKRGLSNHSSGCLHYNISLLVCTPLKHPHLWVSRYIHCHLTFYCTLNMYMCVSEKDRSVQETLMFMDVGMASNVHKSIHEWKSIIVRLVLNNFSSQSLNQPPQILNHQAVRERENCIKDTCMTTPFCLFFFFLLTCTLVVFQLTGYQHAIKNIQTTVTYWPFLLAAIDIHTDCA